MLIVYTPVVHRNISYIPLLLKADGNAAWVEVLQLGSFPSSEGSTCSSTQEGSRSCSGSFTSHRSAQVCPKTIAGPTASLGKQRKQWADAKNIWNHCKAFNTVLPKTNGKAMSTHGTPEHPHVIKLFFIWCFLRFSTQLCHMNSFWKQQEQCASQLFFTSSPVSA